MLEGMHTGVHVHTAHSRSWQECLAAAARHAGADALLEALDKWVTEFTLPNGLKFLVLERHANPVVSCHTFVNAGAYDEPDTETGKPRLLPVVSARSMNRQVGSFSCVSRSGASAGAHGVQGVRPPRLSPDLSTSAC